MESKKIQSLRIKNNAKVDYDSIPVLNYEAFYNQVIHSFSNPEIHCVNYFGYAQKDEIHFILILADDQAHDFEILSHRMKHSESQELASLTPQLTALHIFEREIHENFGVNFINHPWLKPVRYAHNRFNPESKIVDYPFFSIPSNELHEVGVGPIHAGIIEPGHFRFICNGEMVLHLEIQLGWQHRGIEKFMLDKKMLLQRNILAENIAGDTAIGHSLAFVKLMETLAEIPQNEQLELERTIALELERIAVHTTDISALCTDVAYGLGSSIFGVLRTPIINFTQSWCGNRLGKGYNRVGGSFYPFTPKLKSDLLKVLDNYESHFTELADNTFQLHSVENRFEGIGTLTEKQVRTIGAVGMVAKMANVERDTRKSHPFGGFSKYPISPVVLTDGDVYSRFLLRRKEIESSMAWIREVLAHEEFKSEIKQPVETISLPPNQFTLSVTEGWRGEICHCAITDEKGDLSMYKIKDPSIHHWKALELSLRNLEISDFPINNKSYNLSYCGSDL
tara:strand:- start:2360 stop:3883 length:1524 start_codon:yes stop_codon:yes gene_type:complete